jgi:hypothetical protein
MIATLEDCGVNQVIYTATTFNGHPKWFYSIILQTQAKVIHLQLISCLKHAATRSNNSCIVRLLFMEFLMQDFVIFKLQPDWDKPNFISFVTDVKIF